MEEVVVELQVLIYLLILRKRPQSSGQCFYVFQRHPMLVKFLVHAVHIGDDAFRLSFELFVFLPHQTCLFHYLRLYLPVASTFKCFFVQLLILGGDSVEQLGLLYFVEFINTGKICVKLCL